MVDDEAKTLESISAALSDGAGDYEFASAANGFAPYW